MFYTEEIIDVSVLPETVRKILALLKDENLVVKGGLTRFVFLKKILSEDGVPEKIRLWLKERARIEENINDLDIVLFHWKTLKQSKEVLLGEEKKIKEKIIPFLNEREVLFRGQDIEPVKWSKDRRATIQKILGTRDLTINEVILKPEKDGWHICYTPRCKTDLIRGIGALTGNNSRTIRYDRGRIIPGNYGFLRLLKFLVEKKVHKVWLPDWMVKAHLVEVERIQKKEVIPLGMPMGNYGLLLVHQYSQAPAEIKRRWIKVLNKLGFTDLESFELFAQEQALLRGMNGGFFFQDLSFSESIDKMIELRNDQQTRRQVRREEREKCNHNFEETVCKGCRCRCNIKKCPKCDHIELEHGVQELPCNTFFKDPQWWQTPKEDFLFL